MRLIELRAREMDTELSSLYAKYDELRDKFLVWNAQAPAVTGDRVLDFHAINRTEAGDPVFKYAPNPRFKPRMLFFSVESLLLLVDAHGSRALKNAFDGYGTRAQIKERYRSFLNRVFPVRASSRHLIPHNTFLTDGIRIYRHYADRRRRALPLNPDARRAAVKRLEAAPRLEEVTLEQVPTKIIGIDLGDRYCVGACLLDFDANSFTNLAVKKNFFYHGTHEFQMDTEIRKQASDIGSLETLLSETDSTSITLADFQEYATNRENLSAELKAFYQSTHQMSESWNAGQKKQGAIGKTFSLLMQMAGIVEHEMLNDQDSNQILFVIGDSAFASSRGHPSMHSAFLKFFLRMARGMNINVVSLDEYLTSQKCASCFGQLDQVNMRVKFCPECNKFLHRDVSAGECMAVIARSMILGYGRPWQFW